jgi:hypothetical protein
MIGADSLKVNIGTYCSFMKASTGYARLRRPSSVTKTASLIAAKIRCSNVSVRGNHLFQE